MTDIVLTEGDRLLCNLAAELLMALDPGPRRERIGERLLQHYRDDRDDLAAAHPDADPAVIDDMALRFGGALLLAMEAIGLANTTEAELGHA
ncbi:MAG TPA: hypothetical protein VK681_40565 [Reyranella sp.]|jgi:hypothetical protein|nr:hypothetical protein [Reyranella sp.]